MLINQTDVIATQYNKLLTRILTPLLKPASRSQLQPIKTAR